LNEAATVYFTANGYKTDYSWLNWDGNRAIITDFDGLITEYNRRMKDCTSFDTLNMASPENMALAGSGEKATHFNSYLVSALEALRDRYPAEYEKYHSAYAGVPGNSKLDMRKKLYNPLNFIGSEKKSDIAPHFRIRVGTKDNHTAYTVSLILALKLQETDITDVDQAYIWGTDHGGIGKADTGLTDWIDFICRPLARGKE
jgi:hypothetical protein